MAESSIRSSRPRAPLGPLGEIGINSERINGGGTCYKNLFSPKNKASKSILRAQPKYSSSVRHTKHVAGTLPITNSTQSASPHSPKPRVRLNTENQSSKNGNEWKEEVQVAIRMRPLEEKEKAYRRVWTLIPSHSFVMEMTRDGEYPSQRIKDRNFFAFDQTFGEEATTRQVYDVMVKDIVESVVSGRHGAIFAYGQTSSGKTFTMQGSHNARGEEGGLVHMAATDIFQHIELARDDRLFLVRVSFLEVYNEEVRDLLQQAKPMDLRHSPERGTFCHCHEEIVTDKASLLRILALGNEARTVAATSMNEYSSRSHVIFRITIESRAKNESSNYDLSTDEAIILNNKNNNKAAILCSTLNLVDLAGSESVRYTGATGYRLKEGAKINQSLLALSRVIATLGSSKRQYQQHVGYRDSKLTRILQPSLEGNANMAIICCASTSELYMEETRSTLCFASRAKLVKTHAEVNELMNDEQSEICKLQQELARARLELRDRQQSSNERDRELSPTGAEEKLRRLQTLLLNSEILFQNNQPAQRQSQKASRRFSDGNTTTSKPPPAMQDNRTVRKLATQTPDRRRLSCNVSASPTAESEMYRLALSTKSSNLKILEEEIQEHQDTLDRKEDELEGLRESNQQNQKKCLHLERQLFEMGSELSRCQDALGYEILQREQQDCELQRMRKEILTLQTLLDERTQQYEDEKEKACLPKEVCELQQLVLQTRKEGRDKLQEVVQTGRELLSHCKEETKVLLGEVTAERDKMKRELEQYRLGETRQSNATEDPHEEKIKRLEREFECRVLELQGQILQAQKEGQDKLQSVIRKGRVLVDRCKHQAYDEMMKMYKENRTLKNQLHEQEQCGAMLKIKLEQAAASKL